jgi:hypothetical protein
MEHRTGPRRRVVPERGPGARRRRRIEGGSHPSRLRLPVRERRLRRCRDRRRDRLGWSAAERDPRDGRQDLVPQGRHRGRRSHRSRHDGTVRILGRGQADRRGIRLPGGDQGGARRWRQGSAGGPLADEIDSAFDGARREADAYFGNPAVYVEKYIESPATSKPRSSSTTTATSSSWASATARSSVATRS